MKLVSLLLSCGAVIAQEDYHDDNIAMESFSGKSFDELDFGSLAAQFNKNAGGQGNRFSSFLSRAGELFSGMDGGNFGNKIRVMKQGKEKKEARDSKESQEAVLKRSGLPDLLQASAGLANLTNGNSINPNIVSSFLSGGKKVDDMQDELKDLLFGEEDTKDEVEEDFEYDNVTSTSNNDIAEDTIVEGDRAEFDEYDNLEYDQYSYQDEGGNRRMSNDEPLAAELRQSRRPGMGGYRTGVRRRPFRGRLSGAGAVFGGTRKNKLPPIRAPELHKVPGRIQSVPSGQKLGVPYSGSIGSGPRRDRVKRPPHIPDLVSNSVDCDFFTDDLCLGVDRYPKEKIVNLLGKNRRVGDDMIADVVDQSADDLIDGVSSNQESTYTFAHYFGNRREDTSHKHRDFAQEGGFLCPSEIKYAKPKRGKTAQGVWKDIVNVNDYTQTLRMEKCLKPGGSCSYVSHHYKSQCSQVYNYHRLLSWDEERGLHMDIYKVPTCCACHIMGYSYVYPPLKKGGEGGGPQSPAISQGGPQSPAISQGGPQSPAISPGTTSSQLSLPPQRPEDTFPPPNRPQQSFTTPQNRPQENSPSPNRPQENFPPQNRPQENFPQDNFRPPIRPQGGFPNSRPQPDLDNFIPDFNPQQELEAFMDTIGDDFKDFNNFGGKSRPRSSRPTSQQRPMVPFRRPTPVTNFRPLMGGDLRAPNQPPRRRGDHSSSNYNRRGGGFGPGGKPNINQHRMMNKGKRHQGDSEEEEEEEPDNKKQGPLHKYQEEHDNKRQGPLHKYQTIPLDSNTNNQLIRKKGRPDTSEKEGSVNYGYHPIIDFFNPYRHSS